MTHPTIALARLRRPSLLIRAARHGVTDYDRDCVLPRVFDHNVPREANSVLPALIEAEAAIDRDRKDGLATYSIPRHIELLIALMGEARHLARTGQAA